MGSPFKDPSNPTPEELLEQEQQNKGVTLSTDQVADLIKRGLDANSPDGKHQGHGKTVREMRELHTEQRSGRDEMIPANIDHVTINGKPVMIKKCDAHLLHAVIEDVQYNNKGKKLSIAKLQSFSPDDFNKMQNSTGAQSENAFRGLSVQIAHDPNKDTPDAIKIEEPSDKTARADGGKITKNNIHTLNNKKLKEAYQNIFPEEKGNVPPDAMRNQILAKLAEKKSTSDDV